MKTLAAIALPLLLASCGSHRDAAPGGTTAGQDQALNDAAAMLDANSVDAGALDSGNQEQPQ